MITRCRFPPRPSSRSAAPSFGRSHLRMGGKALGLNFNTLSGGTSPQIKSVALTIEPRWVGSWIDSASR